MKIIKHLIIPGGVIYGFSFYGALRHLAQERVWDIKNIQTIHATSVGTIFAVVLSLGYDWTTCDKYVIERPWQQVFKFSFAAIMCSFQNTGIFGIETIEECLVPLLEGKDLTKQVTLAEFYDVTGITLHFYTVDLASLEPVDVSHKTHPTWTLIEAVYSSSCAPLLFKPFQKEGEIYTDGAFYANYPIQPLLDGYPDIDTEEILGININRNARQQTKYYFTKSFTLYDYLLELLFKVIEKLTPHETVKLKHEVFVDSSFVPSLDMYSIVNSEAERRKLVDYGVTCAKTYQAKIGGINHGAP